MCTYCRLHLQKVLDEAKLMFTDRTENRGCVGGSPVWGRGPSDFLGWWEKNTAVNIIYIILVKLHKYFCNANSKQGLAKWLHALVSLLDIVHLSFRNLHHFMLSQFCMSTDFLIPHPQSGGNIWYHSKLSLNFWRCAWWEIIFHYSFVCISFITN